jgi:hypothetical protein
MLSNLLGKNVYFTAPQSKSPMTFRSLLIIILVAFIGFSCSKFTYLQTPLTLDEAIGQQDVLVKTTRGKKYKFDFITKNSDNYQGIKGNGIVPLTTEEVEAVYLRLDKINNATISLINNTKIKGYLLETNDTSVVLAFSDRATPHASFPIGEIGKIKIRKNGSVRKGYLIGTGIGIGTGLGLGAAVISASGGWSSGAGFFFLQQLEHLESLAVLSEQRQEV